MKIIVSIPAYNEEQTIIKVIQDVKKHIHGHSYKILVVNDGSTDKTAELAKNAGAIVYSNPKNLGLMKTFQIELKKCLELKADIIVHIKRHYLFIRTGLIAFKLKTLWALHRPN